MKSLVIIPTYNERENIEILIKKILNLGLNLDILIIDDNSPDGTGDIVEKLKEKNERLKVIHRNRKLGLGTAYIKGFKFALQHNYDYILMMDADLSHNPECIPEFIDKLSEFDLVIGSRYISGGGIVGWPFYRKLLSRLGNVYTRIFTALPIKDCTSGFMAFHRRVLESIDLDSIRSEGYGFSIEFKYRIYKNDFKTCELPIMFVDRVAGKSKISKRIILEAFLLVIKLRIKSMKYKTILPMVGMLLIPFILRLWCVSKVELTPDECYYWEWGRNLDYCYLDQGPMLGFIHFLTNLVFPKSTELTVRLPALIFGFVTMLLGYLLAYNHSLQSAFLTLLLFNIIPLTSIGTMVMVHDNIMIFFWALSVVFVYQFIKTEKVTYLYLTWASAGLATMSKYTGAMFILCFVVLVLVNKKLHPWLKRLHFYLPILLFFIICSPAIVWNIKNRFVTMDYLLGPVVFKPYGFINLRNLFEFIVVQSALITPLIFIVMLLSIYNAVKMSTEKRKFLLAFSLPVLFVFAVFSLFAKTEPNWCAFAYFTLIPLSGIYISDIENKLFPKVSMAVSFIITVVLLMQALTPFLPIKQDPFDGKTRGWKELGTEVSKILQENSDCFLLSNYYWIASPLAFYVAGQPKVECIYTGLALRQYALWSDFNDCIGKNAIYVKTDDYIEPEVNKHFKDIKFIKKVPIKIRKFKENYIIKNFYIFKCIGFKL